MENKFWSTRRYRKFGVVTVIAVYLLILVGGIVRSTGSGMGCPDWPKCFGTWVPPTSVDQLPPDYKEQFQVQGKEIADFNVYHTWTEYINRLIGVLIGFFILITLILSWQYWETDRLIFWLSLVAFLAVGFQGWLGSVVVATDLKPVLITLHMLLALVIVGILIYTVSRSFESLKATAFARKRSVLNFWLIVGLVLSIFQVVLGTQVREQVDLVARSFDGQQRELWVDQLGIFFYFHRTFSLVVMLVNGYIFYLLKKGCVKSDPIFKWAIALLSVIGLEIITGAIMAYFSIPKVLQPVHLLFGTLLFGIQFLLVLFVNADKLLNKEKNQLPYTTFMSGI
ncbi:COX15/CtaA family protein [Flammeovirgaceae bacterium SG7u.111]|nr:COX15/CtaA family protein [Flammeovirgaceae bacterium SG7u.132]WPO33798.1 COX15/CtaA family protein [Flammeovirgaceae bacterium SG7u.111]